MVDFAEREAALAALLTPAEQQEATRYACPAEQQRFRVGRGCLRYLLGQRLKQQPAAIALRASQGKLRLAEPAGLHFNVAHAGDWVVVALAAREIGIYPEQTSPDFDAANLAAEWTTQKFGLIPGYSNTLAYPADWQPVIQFRDLDPRLIN